MRIKFAFSIRTVLILAAALVAALAIFPLIIVHNLTSGHVNYDIASGNPFQKVYSAADFGLVANDMMLKTDDNYNIWVSEVFEESPKAVIIYLSGIHQPSVTYFYGHARLMQAHGYASFLLELRGHGKSDGNRVCLGFEETADVKAVVDYIKSQSRYDGVPIVLHGLSMGGSVAINAFGQIDEAAGLIAMSAYSSFEDVMIDTMMTQYRIPKPMCELERPFISLALYMLFGAGAGENKPVNQVENIGERPALFISSINDDEVFLQNTERLLAAAPDHCESWLRESSLSGHFIVLNHRLEQVEADAEYCARILAFLEAVVAKA